ncbi:MAG: TIGR00730 family Rossman fold protein [Chitinophagaceae bacterium]|nr:TIGR00730 family Rossman fold protein [Chitinophagaceae bacterium]MBL0057383.1 TIGR00730 family Rossman fold protein [Chitinophagaceae bacterium]
MDLSALAVFCGSKSGNNPVFESAARELGILMAGKGITLIYGGGNKGIMGAIANAMLERDGRVIGIIPEILTEWEAHHRGITELIIVESMHVRKKMLYEKCDAAIILPGGFGTLDELFEMLTWNQLNIHNKKIFILNTDGFYDHLIAHAKKMEQEGFLYDRIEERMIVLNKVCEFAALLA